MSVRTAAEIEAAPKITLGGRTFPIFRLAFKQNRVVVGKLAAILPLVAKIEQVTQLPEDQRGGAMIAAFPFDEAVLTACADAVFVCLTRGTPELTRAEFDDLEAGIDEILLALPLVLQASFAFTKKGAGASATPGEATQEPKTLTGTESSSGSAESSAGPGNT